MHSTTTDADLATRAATPRRRVLILRSCRSLQFDNAVRFAREHWPSAEVVGLSHRGHADAMRAAGVDRTLEIPGAWFGVHRMAPWRLLSLCLQRFDAIVLPQMTAGPAGYTNLYWLAAALRPRQVAILGGGAPPKTFEWGAFLRHQLPRLLGRRLVERYNDLALLALLLTACFKRPRRPVARVDGKRRILHIMASLAEGGAQRQLAEFLNRMPPDRYQVDILVYHAIEGDFSRSWLTRDDITVTYLAPSNWRTDRVLAMAEWCSTRQYDLVHTWLTETNAVGAAAARLARVPCVVTAVRTVSLRTRTWEQEWWKRPADILTSRLASAVTVNADALVEDHASWTWMRRARIDVIYNGLDVSALTADRANARQALLTLVDAPDDAILVGTTARLAHAKNQRLFLRVIAQARQVHPTVRGVIIGDGPLRAELEEYAASLGLSDAVSFVGLRKDAVRLAAGLDLFLLPSLAEGFPNALLEAVLLGVPALATRVGGSPEVLGDADLTFDVGDDAGALHAVLRTLDDPAEAAARADRARRRALQLFGADRMTAAWCQVYERCFARAGYEPASGGAARVTSTTVKAAG